MVSEKNIDPRKIIIMIISVILALILKNLIIGTLCIEEYQIAECPNNLNLNSYYIQAENKEDANNQIEIILEENNISLDDYEIKIDNNIIKIIEKEKQETKKTEQAGTEKQETEETTTIQENNLEIENESVEFNENDTDGALRATSGQADFIIYRAPDDLEGIEGKIYMNNGYSYFRYYQIEKLIKDKGLNPRNYNIEIRKETYKTSTTIDGNNFTDVIEIDDYIKIYITKNENAIVEEIKKLEGGGESGTNEINTEELEKINMCICVLLAIMFIYNFTDSMLKRH